MQHIPLVTEELLNSQADYVDSRGLIPELLFRLIAASIQNSTELHIPSGGSVGQRGWDGLVISPSAFDPYVPKGQSFWEIGTGVHFKRKASIDFKRRTTKTRAREQRASTFVFVTPRTWDINSQRKWIDKKKKFSRWMDIRIVSATKIAQWLYLFPGIDLWLAEKFGKSTKGLLTPDMHWEILKRHGSPPELSPAVFLTGREKAREELIKLLRRDINELLLETRYPQSGADFVAATLASLNQEEQDALGGRTLIISDPDTWTSMCQLQTPHVFVGTPDLDLSGSGSNLRQLARNKGHAVVFAATPLGGSHGNKVQLNDIKPYEMEQVLRASGYSPERARTLSNQCEGNVQVLKRLLFDLSVSPDWASSSEASEAAISILIGQWDSSSEGDRRAVEGTVGKGYREWTRNIRPMTLRPDPPLIQQNVKWRFISRFEGWQHLGKYIFDEDLDRFSAQALLVLSEDDPKFILPKEERWAAEVHGKKSKYSETIKEGFAETLALMGSFPDSLSSCSAGKVKTTCILIVRKVLEEDNWVRWATLNGVLPLLAEASPEEFLNAIESRLNKKNNKTFQDIFSQESSGIGGRNYMTGVLWALETLAWAPEHLNRVSVILAHLAEIDPRLSNSANRPSNSLTTIFLPWRPQTCAPVSKRKTALEAVMREHPSAGWNLLLSLMPNSMQVTTGSRRPAWRSFIPTDFPDTITKKDYFDQVSAYAVLAMRAATGDVKKISELIDHLPSLPPQAYSEVLDQLSSDRVLAMAEGERLLLWEKLVSLVVNHRKFADANWAMPEEQIKEIEQVAEKLKPLATQLLHRRLFSYDHDLYEENGNWNEQRRRLQDRRNAAVREIIGTVGLGALFEFSKSVTQPYEVGIALGEIATDSEDVAILPDRLIANDPSIGIVVKAYISRRYLVKGQKWVDGIDFTAWSEEQKAAFLVQLPFLEATWKRVKDLLGSNESWYWKQVGVNPYQMTGDLSYGVEQLLRHGRPLAALECLHKMVIDKKQVSLDQVYRALLPETNITENPRFIDLYSITEMIKWLQGKPEADRDILFRIEWNYLRLLDHHFGLVPKTLEHQLAIDPNFFCEVIRVIYRSHKEKDAPRVMNKNTELLAQNAYELLSNWNVLPGTKDDGSLDGAELNQWIDLAKKSCVESGHETVAMLHIGKVLAHAPADPDGMWIHDEVAKVLDRVDHSEMRSGFKEELFNMRGSYVGTHGEEERAIASRYRKKAEALDNRGYSRLAATLRELAEGYETEAKREAEEDLFDR